MDSAGDLKQEIKCMMVKNLMLQITADEISDELPLFGPDGLGLDSVDALQLVVALDKDYGLKISDPEMARGVLKSVNSIAEALSNRPRPH
jgi:acyl carrier protein